jgi:sugar lactone lactonase YvrE
MIDLRGNCVFAILTDTLLRRSGKTRWIALLCLLFIPSARPSSYFPRKLEDKKAVYVSGTDGNDATRSLQAAIDKVHEAAGQGIVFLPEGRYLVRDTLFVWPGIRLVGYGSTRPRLILPAGTPGFSDAAREKILIFFAGSRPGFGRNRERIPNAPTTPVPDASPGTFYSAISNIDVEIEKDNPGAVVVRARYAQHCFLAHMDLHLGPALAGIHEGGNVVEDVFFSGGRYGIWTSRPSPGWQFTIIDSRFEGQSEAAIREQEGGLTLIRPQFRRVPTAVLIEPGHGDDLWIKDGRLEDISGPAFLFGLEKNPRNEINFEGIVCRAVPLFVELRDSGRKIHAPSGIYEVRTFSHGLHFESPAEEPRIRTVFNAAPISEMKSMEVSDLPGLPPADTWVNIKDLGAKGDGVADDTDAIRKALTEHQAIYFPSGFYVVRDTLVLRPETVIIGLHPGATQILLPDGTPFYQGAGAPKALLETPRGGRNIVIGIGLYTNGNNPRAVAALWKSGAASLMNDVRFLGGHGTPRVDGSRENPYNNSHSADPDLSRRWDSQYPSLWVTDGGGGTFLDIWTPTTFAQAGMFVSDTQTEGRVYQMSSEHHVRYEVQVRNASHWRFYALQTEAERGESGLALQFEIDSASDITVANMHAYRVISSVQPFPWAVKVSNSKDIRFRNMHCYSNSKVSYDSAVYDETGRLEIRQREFAWLDLPGRASKPAPPVPSQVMEAGAKVTRIAGGFFNISGGFPGPDGDFYFVDARWQKIYRWMNSRRRLSVVSDFPVEPVNLAVDRAGNLIVVSYAGNGTVLSLKPGGEAGPLKSAPVSSRPDAIFYLPVSDWRLNRQSLSHPSVHFVSPDGGSVLPAAADFMSGAVSWGVKSSPPIRSFGLAPARSGQVAYIGDEAEHTTWAGRVTEDGSLQEINLFADVGGEASAVDSAGNVYIADGQVYVHNASGERIDMIRVPERPLSMGFGGSDGRTLFICGRTSLYSIRMRNPGR